MQNTFIESGDRVVKADSLYTQTEYHRKTKMPRTTIKYKLLTGALPTVVVNGLILIILEEED